MSSVGPVENTDDQPTVFNEDVRSVRDLLKPGLNDAGAQKVTQDQTSAGKKQTDDEIEREVQRRIGEEVRRQLEKLGFVARESQDIIHSGVGADHGPRHSVMASQQQPVPLPSLSHPSDLPPPHRVDNRQLEYTSPHLSPAPPGLSPISTIKPSGQQVSFALQPELHQTNPSSPGLHAPIYPKIHRKFVDAETLHYYDIPYRIDERDSDYILILQEMSDEEFNVLFEHTRRWRLRRGNGNMPTYSDYNTHQVRRG